MSGQKRKTHPNSLKNLEKHNLAKLSPSERREFARSGALKTNAIKAEKKELEKSAVILKKLLASETTDDIGQKITYKEKMLASLLSRGLMGDKAAIELILKIIDEFPNEKKEILGSLEVQKIFITQSEKRETLKHIESFIDEG